MATRDDVRRIALALPETAEAAERFAFAVRNKDKWKEFVWVWMERFHPKKPRVPNPAVIAVRVPSLEHKDILLGVDPAVFFTEPHYDGYPAVLVRLAAVKPATLAQLIEDAWRCQAPRALVKAAAPPSRPPAKTPKRSR